MNVKMLRDSIDTANELQPSVKLTWTGEFQALERGLVARAAISAPARNDTASFSGGYDFGSRNASQKSQADDCDDGHFHSSFRFHAAQDSAAVI